MITIDAGNSHFSIHQWKNNESSALSLTDLKKMEHPYCFVMSSVKNYPELLTVLKEKSCPILNLQNNWHQTGWCDLKTSYAHSLGEDRLIQIWYASQFVTSPTLLIDAGTFVTADLVYPKEHRGGWILPGREVFTQGFKQGEKLQNESWDWSRKNAPPLTTLSAMQESYYLLLSGLLQESLRLEVKTIILTGGDAAFWQKNKDLFTPLNLQYEENFIHRSLYEWGQQKWKQGL